MIRAFDPTTASDSDLELLARLGLTPSIRDAAQSEIDRRNELVDTRIASARPEIADLLVGSTTSGTRSALRIVGGDA